MDTDGKYGTSNLEAAAKCRAEIVRIRERISELKQLIKSKDPRISQFEANVKIVTYRATIKSIQLQLDHYDPPKARRARRAQRKRATVTIRDSASWDFFNNSGEVWSDLEGNSWEQVESSAIIQLGADKSELYKWMEEAVSQLTDGQRTYINEYYNNGYSIYHIAELYGVDPSTVAVGIRRGIQNMKNWIDAKRLISLCMRKDNTFDWIRYVKECPIFTLRQRQLALIMLSRRPTSYKELSEKLELHRSTVSRTLTRLKRTVQKLGLPQQEPSDIVLLSDWEHANKFDLAYQTDMPAYFYFKYCFRNKVGGVSRYRYELAARKAIGMSAADIADELGMNLTTAQQAYSTTKVNKVNLNDRPTLDKGLIKRLGSMICRTLQRMVRRNVSA